MAGGALVIAGGRETHGRLIVDGAGSAVVVTSDQHVAGDAATGQIIVGNLGTGALEVRNGATVTARNIELGRTLLTDGEVVAAGSGTLTISSGGQVQAVTGSANAYLGVQIAETAGTSAQVTVTGAGSELASLGGAALISLGNAGAGTLKIADGGRARALLLEAAGGATGQAEISVTGAQSELLISDDDGSFAAYPGQAGVMRLGGAAGSSAALSVTSGGTVTVTNAEDGIRDRPSVILSGEAGSTGSLDVAGADSSVNISLTGAANDALDPGSALYHGPRLRLGQAGGSGQASVRDGGRIRLTGENAELWVGEGRAGVASDLSTLSIYSGGQVSLTSEGGESAAFVAIGRNETGRGAVTVSGAGSVLSLTSDILDNQMANGDIAFGATLTVGRLGEGDLTVRNGGRVTIDGHDDAFPGLIIGEGGAPTAAGTVTVTGTDSLIEVIGTNTAGTAETGFGAAGLVAVGLRDGAAGALVINNAGTVRNAANNSVTLIAAATTANGTVRVSGMDSVLAAGALLVVGAGVDLTTIGPDGLPDISVEGGGSGLLNIGADATVSATATVIGATGLLTGTGSLRSDLALHGRLAAAGAGEVGTLSIDGNLSIETGGVIGIDIDAFAEAAIDHLLVADGLTSALTAEMFAFTIDQAAFTGANDPVLLMETTAEIPETDLRITTDEGAVLHLYDTPGTGIMLAFLGLDLAGSIAADTLSGSVADDTFHGSAGADHLAGLSGSDVVDYSPSAEAVRVNLARGTARGGLAEGDSFDGIEDLVGTDAGDLLIGAEGKNALKGGLAGDTLFGQGGGDALFGDAGDDSLSGADGADTLVGGAGNDGITGGAGADLLDGGEDQDRLEGGAGEDTVQAGAGADTIFGGIDADTIEGNGGNDFLYGGLGDDTLAGGSGQDSLYGSGGEDTLFGGQHGDQLFGGVGADLLIGGPGRDLIKGGAGRDVFRYTALADSGTQANDCDLIRDFRQGEDLVELSALDPDSGLTGDQSFVFLGSAAFDGRSGALRSFIDTDAALTRIEADVDGDLLADFSIEIAGLIDFTVGDFSL
ncbi:MAG: M10 family metallopeptidase C-terminal domain-containing protein [Pseudomonadota bacterium]